jgi:hypothetical protein
MRPSLTPERPGGFYSYWVQEFISATADALASEIRVRQMGAKQQNLDFLEVGSKGFDYIAITHETRLPK